MRQKDKKDDLDPNQWSEGMIKMCTQCVLHMYNDSYQWPEHGLAHNKYKAPDIIGDVVDVCN